MDEFKNLDVAGLINDDNVADFALNYRLAYNYFDDLFEGDDKFYKSFHLHIILSKRYFLS